MISCDLIERGMLNWVELTFQGGGKKVYDKLKRFEQIIFDVLSVSLVLFYSYAAVVSPASTQYHRGIYVIITYVLVFLTYQSKS